MPADFLRLVERGLHFVDQVEELGPVGVGHIIWESMTPEQQDRMLGRKCSDCGELQSLCECCEACGFTPCACESRWTEAPSAAYDVEGVEL